MWAAMQLMWVCRTRYCFPQRMNNEHKKLNHFVITALEQEAKIAILLPELALDLEKLLTHRVRISLPRGILSIDLKVKILLGKPLILCEINTSCHERK